MRRMRIKGGKELLGLILLTDERLDDLADRFVDGRVRELLGIRFDQYVLNPDAFDRVSSGLRNGSLVLQRREDEPALSVKSMDERRVDPVIIFLPVGLN